MTSTRRASCFARCIFCCTVLIAIGLSACNPVRLGATLRTGFGRPGESTSSAFTLPSNVAILIEEAPFDPTSHTIKGCGPASGGSKSCLISGRPAFGSADQLPRTYVTGITASFAGRDYKLDVSQMYDAWGTRSLQTNGGVRYFGGSCADATHCTLRGLFSDAAGAYAAEWRIVDGVAVRTVLTDSGDVVLAFRQHIDPPM